MKLKKRNIFFLSLLAVTIFCLYLLFGYYNIMEIGKEEAAKLRDELHNLDVIGFKDREVYYDKLYYIIAAGEGFEPKAYPDTKKKITIGYGFNMDRGEASKREWNDVFNNRISFEKAKNGEITITKEQARMLKRYGVEQREKELARIYAPYWHIIRLNERAILTDLYYQAPALARANTRICSHMKEYYKTGDVNNFKLAVEEVKYHSNNSKNPFERPGLQNRNDIRAIIMDSRESPLYSNPHDELIPVNKLITIKLNDTVISREISKKFPHSNNLRDYYIWRTCMDNKVRSEHAEKEGKVFKYEYEMEHPGQAHGCRCFAEPLPIHAQIIEEEIEEESEDSVEPTPDPEEKEQEV